MKKIDFRPQVKAICKEQGINMSKLATRLGVSSIDLSICLGQKTSTVSLKTLMRIAEALSVNVKSLFPDDEPQVKPIPVYTSEYNGYGIFHDEFF